MSVAIYFSTWDKSKRFFPVLKHSFEKYWPNCPYPVYFALNTVGAPFGDTINFGEDKGWSQMILDTLDKVKEDNIIFMMEDYWLWKEVDQERLNRIVDLIEKKEIDYCRLIPSPGAIQPYNDDINYFNTDFMYRTSLGPGIWNKEFFKSLIVADENPWQFEQNSAQRVHHARKMMCVKDGLLNIVCEYKGSKWWLEPVVGGRLTSNAFLYVQQEQINIDLNAL